MTFSEPTQKHYINVNRSYFDTVFLPAFKDAQKTDLMTKDFAIAGKKIRITFSSPFLLRFMSEALMHHTSFEGAPDLVIHARDSISTGSTFPPPWDNPEHIVEQHHAKNTSFFGVFWHDTTLFFFDQEKSEAYWWVHDSRSLPFWVASSPFRGIFHWFFQAHGMQLMHGSVVSDDKGAVLLTGKSGSGKSTTALSCLLSNMQYIADDYCIVTKEASPWVYNLYCSVKVLPDGFALFPELKEFTVWNKEGFDSGKDTKALLFLPHVFQEPQTARPLLALLVPTITGKETMVRATNKMHAMQAILPSALFQLPLCDDVTTKGVSFIIKNAPIFSLTLSNDIRQISRVIQDFLKEQSDNL